VKPVAALVEQRMGCTAQCPFCGAVCAGGVGCQVEGSASNKHRTEIHMPQVKHYFRYTYFDLIFSTLTLPKTFKEYFLANCVITNSVIKTQGYNKSRLL
jgi:hypothetical protein